MNAVVPAINCQPTATNRKIRRKTDNKPQSQINKCNNEKRRRELENNYIEQLGEFLQLNKRGDMTSTKPDKAAILNQVVKTYRDICDRGNRDISSPSTRCSRCLTSCAENCTLHPVQQGEVSSTEPPIQEPNINGQTPEISAYFEALEHYISSVGWILLQINPEGIIESCTQNIRDLIGFQKSELQKQPIYSYLHAGDHSKLSPILNNMSFNLSGWDTDDAQHQLQQKAKRSITTKVRMLVKHPDGASETMEQKQQRKDKYEEVVLIAAPVKEKFPIFPDDSDDTSSVLCLITRPEDDSPLETNMQQHTPQRPLEQMTLKLDTQGKILEIDTTALRSHYATFFAKERGRSLQDLCHVQDVHRLQAHLKEIKQSAGKTLHKYTSGPFRLRLGSPDAYVHVKASSSLFMNTTPNESDYIMSWLTILNSENDMSTSSHSTTMCTDTLQCSTIINKSTSSNIVSGVSGIQSLPSTSHHHTSTTTLGGPLMTSVINGTIPLVQPSSKTNNVLTSFPSPPSASEGSNFFQSDSFELEYISTHSPQFQLDISTIDYRPDSRASVTTPVSTPRPPSVQAFSPLGQNVCPSPLTPYHTSQNVGQPSPQGINNNNNNTSINNNNNGGFHGFGFPNFDEKDHINNNTNNNNNNNIAGQNCSSSNKNSLINNQDSARLRNLLTKRTQSSSGNMQTDEQEHKNRILMGLLNAEEEKESGNYNKLNFAVASRIYGGARLKSTDNKNQMLLQLLNDKSDDDDPDSRSRQSELLRQLQKEDTPKDHSTSASSNQMQEEDLKILLRIQGNDFGNRKRANNDSDDGRFAKRPDEKKSSSLLREKNKMLASLLSNPSKAPTTVPTKQPMVTIIPDITSSTVNRVSSTSSGNVQPAVNQQQQHNSGNNSGQQKLPNQTNQQSTNSQANQPRNIRKPSEAYLNQTITSQPQGQPPDQNKNTGLLTSNTSGSSQLSSLNSNIHLQQQQQQQQSQSSNFSIDNSQFSSSTASSASILPSLNVSSQSSAISQQITSSSGGLFSNAHILQNQSQNEVDPELSKILNDVIDFVPDIFSEQSLGSSTPIPSQQDINEKMAINAIQKSLMQIENHSFNSPPAYSALIGSQHQQNNQGFQQPPPIYPARSGRIPVIPNTVHNAAFRQQYRERILQMQQKERLLQQQQKQQLVVPESANVRPDHLSLNQNMSNIGSLLNINNTVAPNVSLTRSNMLPDSQLSPSYPQNLMNQQLSPGQRNQPFNSPQNQGYASHFSNNGQRLSPQQQLSQAQQQQINFQASSNTQLSPRQPPFIVNAQSNVSAVGVPQQQQPTTQPNQQWNTGSNANIGNSRISLQQHNPMLSAQLQGVSPYNSRQFQNQRRQMNSSGNTVSRQNSFPSQDNNFPGPSSPSTQASYGNTNVFNSQQIQRIHRQTSVPQATQHLPGSPRPFGGTNGTGGYGMVYNNIQHSAQGPPPNDFFGRNQTAGNGMNSSEYVRQELRAVVSGRTQQSVLSGNISGGGSSSIVVSGNNSIRTPQSPLGIGQGTMGTNNTSSIGMQQSQQQQQRSNTPQQQLAGSAILNTPPDPTLFSFDLPQSADFFGANTTR